MLTEVNKFDDWLNDELNERGWSYNELARRAGISGGSISHIMNQRRRPGYDVCMGIARALGGPPEHVLRRAKLLPSLPESVEEEQAALVLFRRMEGQMRKAILAMMQSLLGVKDVIGTRGVTENRSTYQVASTPEPRTVSEWLSQQIGEGLRTMSLEDQQAVFDFMKRRQGAEGESSAPSE